MSPTRTAPRPPSILSEPSRSPGDAPFPRVVGPAQPLGASGKFFLALARQRPTRLSRVIAIEGSLPPQRIQAALRRLQARHPLMRARVIDGGAPHIAHDVPGAIELSVIPRESAWHWQRVLESLLEERSLPTSPLFSAHYVYAPSARRQELILVAEHVVADGVCMNALCAELFALCGGEPALPSREIQPTLEELLPESSRWERATSFGLAMGRLARVVLSRTLREKRTAAVGTAYTYRELTSDETTRLLTKARNEKTTVTGALLAATMQAVGRQKSGTPQLAITVPVDLRPRIAAGRLTSADVGHYTSVVYLASRARQSFWPLARSLKSQLDRTAGSKRLLAELPMVYRAGRRFMHGGRPPLAHVMVSSSGIVPLSADYGTFRTVGFHSATSIAMLSADLGFFCNTMHGRLCVNLVFSERVISRSDAELVIDSVVLALTRL